MPWIRRHNSSRFPSGASNTLMPSKPHLARVSAHALRTSSSSRAFAPPRTTSSGDPVGAPRSWIASGCATSFTVTPVYSGSDCHPVISNDRDVPMIDSCLHTRLSDKPDRRATPGLAVHEASSFSLTLATCSPRRERRVRRTTTGREPVPASAVTARFRSVAAVGPWELVGLSCGSFDIAWRISAIIGASAGETPPGMVHSVAIRSRNVGRCPVIRCKTVTANEYTSAGGPTSSSPSSSSGLAYANVIALVWVRPPSLRASAEIPKSQTLTCPKPPINKL
jgi:hypothetical protein